MPTFAVRARCYAAAHFEWADALHVYLPERACGVYQSEYTGGLKAGVLDPGRKAKASLTRVAGDFAPEQLRETRIVPPAAPVDCCAAC